MRKYILSAALISALSSSTLSAANLGGLEISLGASGFVSVTDYIKPGAAATPVAPVAGATTTAATPVAGATTPAAPGFFNGLNSKFDVKYLMNTGFFNILVGGEIEVTNSQNFLGMDTSYKYTADTFKVSDGNIYFAKAGVIDATAPKTFYYAANVVNTVVNTAVNTAVDASLTQLRGFTDANVKGPDAGVVAITKTILITTVDDALKDAHTAADTTLYSTSLKEFGSDDLPTLTVTAGSASGTGDAVIVSTKIAGSKKYKEIMGDAALKPILEKNIADAAEFTDGIDALLVLKDVDFKGAEVSRAFKAAMFYVPIQYTFQVSDNLNVNVGAKFGGGYLSSVEKVSKDCLKLVSPVISASAATHNATQLTTQDGLALSGGATLGVSYTVSEAIQLNANLSATMYQNIAKTTTFEAYKIADTTKKNLLTPNLNKAFGLQGGTGETNTSYFGNIETAITIGFTFSL